MIPISKVEIDEEIENEVLSVLRSGSIAQGPKVKELEDLFASMMGIRNVVAVNNGTTALVAALELMDVSDGDEVITSPFTFVATVNAILRTGATIRFADISSEDFNVSPVDIERKINNNTKILVPVHLYGQMADMNSISKLADKNKLRVIEDAAQSHLARQGRMYAGYVDIGCFSLYATKNITSAEGGLITTNDDTLAEKLRILRNQGMRNRYEYVMSGNNYRLTDVHAAICMPQLRRYPDIVLRRRKNAERLANELSNLNWITVPKVMPDREHVWHQFTILIDSDFRLSRGQVSELLSDRGVATGAYYPKTIQEYDCFKSHPQIACDSTPIAKDIASRCLSLPVHPGLTSEDISHIINSLKALG